MYNDNLLILSQSFTLASSSFILLYSAAEIIHNAR